jgi:ABC-type anion transport system duplicated permease subunit
MIAARVRLILIGLGIGFLQLILTQGVTFVASLLLPGMGDNLLGDSAAFALVLGITFTTGAFLGGWIALKQGWLKAEPRLRLRLAATLAGAYLPLVLALILYRVLEPGNPFFFVAALGAVVAFHFPTWIRVR